MAEVLEKQLDGMIHDVARGDQRLVDMLGLCWKRVILKQDARIPIAEDALRAHGLKLSHVRDWLAAAIASEARWLSNVDMVGRAKKLLKFGSIDALLREVDRDMARFARNNRKVELDPAEEVVEMELGDGWMLVRMLTPRALDLESGRMGHCIGGGAYDAELLSGTSRFLSLRDPRGKPHVTISIREGEIGEVSGKANDRPPFRYIERLAPFFADYATDFYFDGTNGVVIDTKGKLYPVDALPEHLEVKGDLDLFWSDGALGETAPRTIRADGSVIIEFDATVSDKGERHPMRLDAVSGKDVYLIGLKLDRFPEIECQNNLTLDQSDFHEMPAGMIVGGNLSMKGAGVERLPDGLNVVGHLDVSGMSVKVIPSDLRARSITMTASAITNLPAQRDYVSIHAAKSELADLGTGLNIEREMDISETKVKYLSEDIRVPRLYAWDCRLRLPRSLRGVVEADFMGSTIVLTDDFECPDRVRFRAAVINLFGKRLIGRDLIDLSCAHFDGLPSVIRAGILDMRRMAARPMPVLDVDIETRILALSDADMTIGPGVRVTEFVDIGGEWDRIRFAPDAARDYLSRRRDFENLEAAKKHYGGFDVKYDHHEAARRYPTWTLKATA
jgi:hypothetical protein